MITKKNDVKCAHDSQQVRRILKKKKENGEQAWNEAIKIRMQNN